MRATLHQIRGFSLLTVRAFVYLFFNTKQLIVRVFICFYAASDILQLSMRVFVYFFFYTRQLTVSAFVCLYADTLQLSVRVIVCFYATPDTR